MYTHIHMHNCQPFIPRCSFKSTRWMARTLSISPLYLATTVKPWFTQCSMWIQHLNTYIIYTQTLSGTYTRGWLCSRPLCHHHHTHVASLLHQRNYTIFHLRMDGKWIVYSYIAWIFGPSFFSCRCVAFIIVCVVRYGQRSSIYNKHAYYMKLFRLCMRIERWREYRNERREEGRTKWYGKGNSKQPGSLVHCVSYTYSFRFRGSTFL